MGNKPSISISIPNLPISREHRRDLDRLENEVALLFKQNRIQMANQKFDAAYPEEETDDFVMVEKENEEIEPYTLPEEPLSPEACVSLKKLLCLAASQGKITNCELGLAVRYNLF